MGIIKGQNLRLKVDNKFIAFATTCTVHLSTSTEDSSTKDDTADWSDQEITGLSWDASTSALFSIDQDGIDSTGRDGITLMDLFIQKKTCDVEIRLTSGAKNREVANVSWPTYYGRAIINDLSINASNRQNASYDIQLMGKGMLSTTPPSTPASSSDLGNL